MDDNQPLDVDQSVSKLLQQLSIEGDTDAAFNGTGTFSSTAKSTTSHGDSFVQLMATDSASPARSGANNSGTSSAPRTITRRVDASGKNIFVNGLPQEVNDADLRRMFERFGSIVSTHVLCDLHSSKSRGMGFVHFADVDAVTAAVREMNGHKFASGATLHVRVAYDDAEYTSEETNKLFVRQVPAHVTTAQLWAFFESFGTVVQATIHEDISARGRLEQTGDNMAYVTFNSIEEANAALAQCCNVTPFGGQRALIVKRAESLKCRNQRLKRLSNQNSPQTSGSSMTSTQHSPQQQQQHLPISSVGSGLSGGSSGGGAGPMFVQPTVIPMAMGGAPIAYPGIPIAAGQPFMQPVMLAPGQMPTMMIPGAPLMYVVQPSMQLPMMQAAPQMIPATFGSGTQATQLPPVQMQPMQGHLGAGTRQTAPTLGGLQTANMSHLRQFTSVAGPGPSKQQQ